MRDRNLGFQQGGPQASSLFDRLYRDELQRITASGERPGIRRKTRAYLRAMRRFLSLLW